MESSWTVYVMGAPGKSHYQKVNRALFGLNFIQSCTTQGLRKRLVESLVIPHLDYCSVVYLDVSSSLRTRLQRLSNACVRFIFGVRRNTHITPYRRQLEWLRSDTRRDYFALLLMYKIVRFKEPPILLPLFTTYQSDRPTRGPRKDLDTAKLPSDTFQVRETLELHPAKHTPPALLLAL